MVFKKIYPELANESFYPNSRINSKSIFSEGNLLSIFATKIENGQD
jgi:hypothetical protein